MLGAADMHMEPRSDNCMTLHGTTAWLVTLSLCRRLAELPTFTMKMEPLPYTSCAVVFAACLPAVLWCSLFQEVYSDLLKAAKQGKGAAVKIAAAEALAVCCFVAAEDEHTTLDVMAQLQGLWHKGGCCCCWWCRARSAAVASSRI